MRSKFLRLSLWDFTKGLIVALLYGIADSLVQPHSLKEIGVSCLIVFCVYLAKNIVTNSSDQLLKPDKKE